VEDDHLTICDGQTIEQNDLVEADRISTTGSYVGEIYYVKHNPVQRWYFLDKQQPEEMTIFVSFDSEKMFKNSC